MAVLPRPVRARRLGRLGVASAAITATRIVISPRVGAVTSSASTRAAIIAVVPLMSRPARLFLFVFRLVIIRRRVSRVWLPTCFRGCPFSTRG